MSSAEDPFAGTRGAEVPKCWGSILRQGRHQNAVVGLLHDFRQHAEPPLALLSLGDVRDCPIVVLGVPVFVAHYGATDESNERSAVLPPEPNLHLVEAVGLVFLFQQALAVRRIGVERGGVSLEDGLWTFVSEQLGECLIGVDESVFGGRSVDAVRDVAGDHVELLLPAAEGPPH